MEERIKRKRSFAKNNDFEKIGGVIEGYIKGECLFTRHRDVYEIKKAWPKIAGDFISSNTSIVSLNEGVLIINATASPFLFHLSSFKKKYLNDINSMFPQLAVKEIFFKVGKINSGEAVEKCRTEEIIEQAKCDEIKSYNIENIEIAEDALSSIKDFVSSLNISDCELKEKILNAAKTIYKITQYKKRNGYVECDMCSSLFLVKTQNAGKNDIIINGCCEYCLFKIKTELKKSVLRIKERPWENYEIHVKDFTDVDFREFEYIRKIEFKRAKENVEELIRRYVTEETEESFVLLDENIRRALSLHEHRNYYEVVSFGEKGLDLIANILGPNARAVFARGSMISRFK